MDRTVRKHIALLFTISIIVFVVVNTHPAFISRETAASFRSDVASNINQRLSDVLVIGVSKCGTAALMFFLDLLPQVFIIRKEIQYLCDDQNYTKGLGFYYEKLPKGVAANDVIVERDGTCWRKDRYAERVYKTYERLNKTLKIVVVVCDPTYRVQSWYKHGTQNTNYDLKYGKYNVDFDKLAFMHDGSVNSDYEGIKSATYDERLKPWLTYFDRRQIHVIDGLLLKKDPYRVIRGLGEFLNLDRLVTRENFYFNETKGYFCKVKHPPGRAAVCMISTKGRYHPDIDPKLTRKLYDHFKPHNNKFEELTGQKFLWSRY